MYNQVFIKLKELKKEYPTEVDQKFFNEKETKLRKAIVNKRLLDNDAVKDIIKDTIEKIASINYLLAWDDDMTEATRDLLFAEKKVHKFWLDRLGVKEAEEIIKSIEESVERQLNN